MKPNRTETVGSATLLCSAVLSAIALYIYWQWSVPGRAWVHPELLPVGERIWTTPWPSAGALSILFDWHLFDPNPHRQRIISDLFEIIDAILRPYIAQVLFHPVIGLTIAIFLISVPLLAFKTLRVYTISVPQALLITAFLITTPGFLSNCFVYIRPAKPLSFVLLTLTIFLVGLYSMRGDRRALTILPIVLLLGLFTDELLFWSPIFVAVCFCLAKPMLLTKRVAGLLLAPLAVYLLFVLFVSPALYQWLGPGGPRILSFTNPQTGDQPLLRMLSYLWSTDFVPTSLIVTARSFAANVGVYASNNLVISLVAAILLSAATVLFLYRSQREAPVWQLSAMALFGFCSFSIFATWLDWYNFPHSNEDLVAMLYYYHSPISYFFALIVAAGMQTLQRVQPLGRLQRPLGAIFALAIVVIAIWNVRSFLPVNDVVRIVHIGPTNTAAFFRAADAAKSSTPSQTLVTGDPRRMTHTIEELDRAGYQVFGSHWTKSSLYRRGEDFDNMPWYGPSYANFGRLYLTGLCTLFFGDAPCPVRIEEH